jgi:hypothetical protein
MLKGLNMHIYFPKSSRKTTPDLCATWGKNSQPPDHPVHLKFQDYNKICRTYKHTGGSTHV